MKIELLNEDKRKSVYDIFNIFYDEDQIIFGEGGEIKIDNSHVVFNNKIYDYEDNLALKSILYKILIEKTGYRSPRGLLTGSKPSKLLKKYKPQELIDKFYISDEKLAILTAIENGQNKLSFNKKDFNLYINIPFCPSRCNYCSYPTLIGSHHDKSKYIDYLIREIDMIDLPKNLDTVYIGGGTPSFLSHDDLKRLLQKINNKFSFNELTFEAGREDTIDYHKLEIFKDNDVDRLSLNPQTFNEDIIRSVGRSYDKKHFLDIYDKAYDMGFIINMDFIIGLIGEDYKLFNDNFRVLELLKPHNITFHALALKVGSKYFEEGKISTKEDAIKISNEIEKFTYQNDYKPYYLYRQKNIISNLENIGYQRDDSSQRYNIIINDELENIIGLGMNANSKLINGKKYRNAKNLRDYIKNLDYHIASKNKLIYEYNH